MLTPWKESYDQPRQHIKKQRHYFVNKGLSSQGYGFSSSHVGIWELDYKEIWVLKNWCFWTVVWEKTLESTLDCKEIQPVHPKGDQSWVFIGRTDVEAETPILWPPDVQSWLLWKDSDAGRDWGQKEKGTTEDEMAGCHHWLDGCESEWTLGVGDGQSGSSWWTGRPGMLRFMGSQRVGHDWATELNLSDEVGRSRTRLSAWTTTYICRHICSHTYTHGLLESCLLVHIFAWFTLLFGITINLVKAHLFHLWRFLDRIECETHRALSAVGKMMSLSQYFLVHNI